MAKEFTGGALKLQKTKVSPDLTDGSAMVPLSVGSKKVGVIELKSPIDTLKDVFFDIKDGIYELIGIEKKENDIQPIPDASADDFAGVDTDEKKSNIAEFETSALNSMLGSLQESFEKVSFGEKMTALLFTGGLLLFTKFRKQLETVLTPVIQFVMDLVESLGVGGTLALFLGTFLAFKTGLAQWVLKFTAGGILKGLKATNALIGKQGGLWKSMGLGFEKMNKGMKGLTKRVGKLGGFITKNLTKGFTKLGDGVKAMNKGVGGVVSKLGGGFSRLFGFIGKGFTGIKVGLLSMQTSLAPILAPLLPIIAIAAGIAAVMYSLKSGFDTFKQSLEDGDSMFTAVLKGLTDAMLTLVTLPATLVKKLVGWIAGLLGFEDFKKKLEEFSFKDMIKNTFTNFTSGMVRVIKAIAKGAGAALAALAPGGESPAEAYQRVYQEVMSSGKSEDMPTDGGAKFVDVVKMTDEETGTKVSDASAAESFYANQRATDEGNKVRARNYTSSMATISQGISSDAALNDSNVDTSSNVMNKKLDSFMKFMIEVEKKKELQKMRELKEKSQMVQVNNQGDVYNQKSETNITGDLEVNNTESSQRLINAIA